MKRRIFIYAALVALLTLAGILASLLIFGEKAKEILPAGQSSSNKELRKSKSVLEDEPRAPGMSDDIKVLLVNGSASRFHSESENWMALLEGEALGNDDRVQTGKNSRVTLRIGKDSKLELAEYAELNVGKKSAKDRRFKLIRGRVGVEYREKDRRLRIENEDGSAVAETEEGIFAVLNTGTTIAVATKTGSVDLFANGQKVAVQDGQQSIASDGAPSKPRPIPVDVMLRIVDPGCRVQREGFIVLKGRTTPGAAVTANGSQAKIRSNGKFLVHVPLKVGKNNIVVVTTDPSGHKKTRTFPCVTVDPGAPIKKIDIKWGPVGGREES